MIEPASPKDAEDIQRIAATVGVFSEREVESVGEMLGAFFNPSPDDDHVFIIYRDGTRAVRGFACYGPTPFTDRVWEVYWICVERSHQRNHAGHALMEQICIALRTQSIRQLYLETSDSEAYRPARTFYTSEGFDCVAHLHDFYARGEGKMIFRKTLEPESD